MVFLLTPISTSALRITLRISVAPRAMPPRPKAEQWERALGVFAEMRLLRVPRDVITFNSAASLLGVPHRADGP